MYVRTYVCMYVCVICSFVPRACMSRPLTNPTDRKKTRLSSIAAYSMIPKELSTAVKSGKFPTSSQDFVVDARLQLNQPVVPVVADDDATTEQPADAAQNNGNAQQTLRFVAGELLLQ